MKNKVIIFGVILIIFLLIGFIILNRSYSDLPQQLSFWEKSELECVKKDLDKLKIITSNGTVNLLQLCESFTKKTISDITNGYGNLKLTTDNIQKGLYNPNGNLKVYENNDIAVVLDSKINKITELALGQGLTTGSSFDFTYREIEDLLGIPSNTYTTEEAEVPFVQVVYPEYGLALLYYKESKDIISLNLFSPVSNQVFQTHNKIGEFVQLLKNYNYSVHLKN